MGKVLNQEHAGQAFPIAKKAPGDPLGSGLYHCRISTLRKYTSMSGRPPG